MSKNTEKFKAIVKELKSQNLDSSDISDKLYNLKQVVDLGEGLGEVEMVYEKGGGEGGGQHVEKVFYFKAFDVYVKITGSYYSYDGTTWDSDFYEVIPHEVVSIEYTEINQFFKD